MDDLSVKEELAKMGFSEMSSFEQFQEQANSVGNLFQCMISPTIRMYFLLLHKYIVLLSV